ncbi:hypothetical protein V5O48_005795 [Marasmius crinis-equi]|uniref:Uncharacterized protein n=1 Tax=Marasmius crinis-equi TaxID=585013 RepID=A0ABR3FLA0_9AGAR
MSTDDETTHPASYFVAINQITGVLSHSDACQVLLDVENDPPIPLHPLVRSRALELILHGSSLYFLKSEIKEFVKQTFGEDTHSSKSHRYFLESHDTSAMYRTTRRFFGVCQRIGPEETLDLWLRSHNPNPPSPLIRDSCLHYQPQLKDDKLVIATPDMKKAAWDHAHNQHILMDLTFGFCSSSLLLTLLMAFDNARHGVPVGALLFSACRDAKAAHADYDTRELTRLVGVWKDGLGLNSAGEKINIKVATTDQDPRERNTLSTHWPEIFLLLDATRAFEAERQYLLRLGRRQSAVAKKQAKGGLLFLSYLGQYHLKSEDYWMSWSPAGALEVSQRLDIPVEHVPRTNNPLEGFNRRIKGQYIAPYTRGGRLPRIDVWVYVFITFVILELFQSFREKEEQQKFCATFRSTCPASSSDTCDTSTTSESSSTSKSSTRSAKSKIQTPEFTVEELEKEGGVEDAVICKDDGDVLVDDSGDEVGDEELKELAAQTTLFVEETQFDMTPDEPALDADDILAQLCEPKHHHFLNPDEMDDMDPLYTLSPPSSPLPSRVDDTYEPPNHLSTAVPLRALHPYPSLHN